MWHYNHIGLSHIKLFHGLIAYAQLGDLGLWLYSHTGHIHKRFLHVWIAYDECLGDTFVLLYSHTGHIHIGLLRVLIAYVWLEYTCFQIYSDTGCTYI